MNNQASPHDFGSAEYLAHNSGHWAYLKLPLARKFCQEHLHPRTLVGLEPLLVSAQHLFGEGCTSATRV
jgi:hypothetical protein